MVYRQERVNELTIEAREGIRFRLLANPADLLCCLTAVWRLFGLVGMLKTAAKLATPSRLFYAVMAEGRIVNGGWISVSFCRHYRVGPGEVVIGPVETEEASRGKGLATWGLKHAINAMVRRGNKVFFIDTSDGNVAMQKVIGACGFGQCARLTAFSLQSKQPDG